MVLVEKKSQNPEDCDSPGPVFETPGLSINTVHCGSFLRSIRFLRSAKLCITLYKKFCSLGMSYFYKEFQHILGLQEFKKHNFP